MIRQLPQRCINDGASLFGTQLREYRVGNFPIHLRSIRFAVFGSRPHLREETPALAISIQIIERQVGGDGLEPAARRHTGAQIREMFVGADEHLLGNVLRLRVVARQAGGSRKNHVLIGTHECRKLSRSLRLHWNVCSFRNKTPLAWKSCCFSRFAAGAAPSVRGPPRSPPRRGGCPAEPAL